MLDQADTAVIDCDEAPKIQPDYVDALDSRGLANLKLGSSTERFLTSMPRCD